MKLKLFKTKTGRSLFGDTVILVLLLLLGLVMAFPLFFSVFSAFKPLDELMVFPPHLFVRNPTFGNFTGLPSLFANSQIPLSRYLTNTIFITVIGTAGSVIVSAMAGYVLEKKRFPMKKFIFKVIVSSLMFTSAVTAVPSFLIISRLNWIDSYAAILIPAMGSTLNVFLMKQFMESVPDTIIEAARIDGAGENLIFWQMVMPMVKPAWMTVIIFSFQGFWGNTGSSYIYAEELKTLPYALSQVVSSGIMRSGYSAAISALMMIVPITVFIITQSNVIETMVSSGIKE